MSTGRKAPPTKRYGVILLSGAEEFLIREELERLLRDIVTDESRDFDFTEFRSNEVDPGTLWNALITLPLLAPTRVVVLHLQGDPKDDLLRILNRYTVHPSSTTILIMVQIIEDRGNPVKLEGDVHAIVHAPLKSREKRTQWARDYVAKAGKELAAEAAEYIVDNSSHRLSDIAAKLDHVMLYSGDDRTISGNAVQQVSGVTSEYLPWDIEDAILERHPHEIFKRVRALEAGGEELLRLLAYQRPSLILLWQVAYAVRTAGKSKQDRCSPELVNNEVSQILGSKKWKLQKFVKAATAIREPRLQRAVVDLLDLEARIKTGRGGWMGYYEWIWKLIDPASGVGTSYVA